MIVIAQQSLKNKILKKIFFFFFLVIISPPFLFGQEFIEDISFNVYRNESKIGYHKLNFKREEDRIIASIEIKFEVNFLGFTLYDYFHKNKEVWIADSLFKLKTNTDVDRTYSWKHKLPVAVYVANDITCILLLIIFRANC